MSFFDTQDNNSNPFVGENQGGYGIPNDPNNKWNNLQQECFQSVTKISSETSQVQRMLSKIGSNEDSIEFRSQIQKKLHQIRQMSTTTSANIKELQKMSNESQDKKIRADRKLVCTKLSKDFSDYLQVHQRLSKEWIAKEKQVIPPKPSTYASQNRFYQENDDEERTALLASEKVKLNLVEKELDFQDDIIADREAGIAEVQRDMLKVNDMFKDMHQIVVEQGNLVDSIENHIEHARFDVEKGVETIEEAKVYQKKANSKTKYAVCLLIIIIAVIIVIAALSAFVFTK